MLIALATAGGAAAPPGQAVSFPEGVYPLLTGFLAAAGTTAPSTPRRSTSRRPARRVWGREFVRTPAETHGNNRKELVTIDGGTVIREVFV